MNTRGITQTKSNRVLPGNFEFNLDWFGKNKGENSVSYHSDFRTAGKKSKLKKSALKFREKVSLQNREKF